MANHERYSEVDIERALRTMSAMAGVVRVVVPGDRIGQRQLELPGLARVYNVELPTKGLTKITSWDNASLDFQEITHEYPLSEAAEQFDATLLAQAPPSGEISRSSERVPISAENYAFIEQVARSVAEQTGIDITE